jgi:hypothetical protein
VQASALELASLAEAFGPACSCSRPATTSWCEPAAHRGVAGRSTARSDEQLAYYVAQAREVIDLSIASQQGLVDNLRQLQARPARRPGRRREARRMMELDDSDDGGLSTSRRSGPSSAT